MNTSLKHLYKDLTTKLIQHKELSANDGKIIYTLLFSSEVTEIRRTALLTHLAHNIAKNQASATLEIFRCIMQAATKFPQIPSTPFMIDTCGSGGSSVSTLNISTIMAFALVTDNDSKPSIQVIKHGNHKSSGLCGSMDFLDQLGITYDVSPKITKTLLQKTSLGFLYARRYHPIFKQVTTIRQQLGFATLFNFLGPLANPAPINHQIFGLANKNFLELLLEMLKMQLFNKKMIVVHSLDNLDEVSLSAPTDIFILDRLNSKTNQINKHQIRAEDFGIHSTEIKHYQGFDAQKNYMICRNILQGNFSNDIQRAQHIAVNLATILVFLLQHFTDLKIAYEYAMDLLGSGNIWKTITKYQKIAASLQ